MGNCTSSVNSDFHVHEYGSHPRHEVVGSVHSQQGTKGRPNQDSAILSHKGFGSEGGTLCAVFDGHGINGHVVSRVARNRLPTLLLNQKKFMGWNEAFVSAFKEMEKEIKLITEDCTSSGSAAVVVVRQGEDLVIANLGDSRAVLGSSTEDRVEAIQLTVDLKPDVPGEFDRIKKANGRVFASDSRLNIQRVWLPDEDFPGLAMSRAFGDFEMKKCGIIVIPEVTHRRLTSNDLFIVLASDGVWDVLSNEEVVSVVMSVENKEAAAKAVVDKAVAAWKHKFPSAKIDDCTVVCQFLQEKHKSSYDRDTLIL